MTNQQPLRRLQHCNNPPVQESGSNKIRKVQRAFKHWQMLQRDQFLSRFLGPCWVCPTYTSKNQRNETADGQEAQSDQQVYKDNWLNSDEWIRSCLRPLRSLCSSPVTLGGDPFSEDAGRMAFLNCATLRSTLRNLVHMKRPLRFLLGQGHSRRACKGRSTSWKLRVAVKGSCKFWPDLKFLYC